MTIITRENYGNDNNHNNALRIDKQWCVCMCIYNVQQVFVENYNN